MKTFVLVHGHAPSECRVAYAAWSGFSSPLCGVPAQSTCARFPPARSPQAMNGPAQHEIWWTVQAEDVSTALALLPPYVRERSEAREVTEVTVG
jgi:hypothetical protein